MTKKFVQIFFLVIVLSSCNKKLQPSEFHILKLKLIKKFEDSPQMYVPPQNKTLSFKLKSVNYDDQFFRDIKNPKYYLENQKKQDLLDKKNLEIVTKILDEHGYLGMDDIGYIANHGINLTLEHAPFNIKLKYMPIIDSAFKYKKIDVGVYTIYKDKMAVKEKRLQEYGTQIILYENKYTFYPLDPQKTDSVRKKTGLPQDLKTYLKTFFNTDFDSLKYLKQLPNLKKSFNIK